MYHAKERGRRDAIVFAAMGFGGQAHLHDALDALRENGDRISGSVMEQEPVEKASEWGVGKESRAKPAALLQYGLIGAVDGGGVQAAQRHEDVAIALGDRRRWTKGVNIREGTVLSRRVWGGAGQGSREWSWGSRKEFMHGNTVP
jgi:hypothetical protein